MRLIHLTRLCTHRSRKAAASAERGLRGCPRRPVNASEYLILWRHTHRRRCCWHIHRDSSQLAQSRRTGRIEAENGLYREAPAGGPWLQKGRALLCLPKPRLLHHPFALGEGDAATNRLHRMEMLRSCCIASGAPSAVMLSASSDSVTPGRWIFCVRPMEDRLTN